MNITYCVLGQSGINKNDRKKFKKDLANALIPLEQKYQVTYILTKSNKAPKLHLILAKRELADKLVGDGIKGFSWTDLSCNVIMFSYENWKHLFLEPSKPVNNLYKKYLIQHELLHAFPFYQGHNPTSCHTKGAYNVMYQHTRNAVRQNDTCKETCPIKDIMLPEIHGYVATYQKYNKENEYKLKKLLFQKILEECKV